MKTSQDHGILGDGNNRVYIESHLRKHLSDLLGGWLIQTYGGEKYGDGSGLKGSRTVFIGRGGYDEHGDPESRKCEAIFIAEDLKVVDLPELQSMLEYTRSVDRDGEGKSVLKFGRLVELMHNVHEPLRVELWTRVLIEACVFAELEKLRGKTIPSYNEAAFKCIMAAYRRVKEEFPSKVREELEATLNAFSPSMEVKPFDLMCCVGLLCHRFRSVPWWRAPIKWAEDALRAELVFQRMFLEAEPQLDAAIDCSLTVKGRNVAAALVHSDQQRIHSVVFSEWGSPDNKNVVLVVVRRVSGHVQIFRRKRGTAWFDTTGLVAELRAREDEKWSNPPAPFGELSLERSRSGNGCWFFQERTGHIFNGALSAPGVKPTKLSDNEIIDAILVGVDDRYGERREEGRFAHSKALAEARAG